MFKVNFKKILLNSIIILVIFMIDRVSKIYILNVAELENTVDVYVTSYLNLYLIWNKGIAFGLFSINENLMYNLLTCIIALITFIVLVMAIWAKKLKRYPLIIVFSGSIGNLFDRVYYSAVPDFIDFHINNFHWFIFNVADIFITFGIVCLIIVEIFFNNEKNEKTI